MPNAALNILVLHNAEDLRKARRSVLDYIFAFQRYQPQHRYHYHRISDPPPSEMKSAPWDVVILDSTALGICTFRPRELFFETVERWSFLANEGIVKLVFPQDDANHSGVMDDWFAKWGVQLVFSVRPEHKTLLYPKTSMSAEFQPCLAGYIDDVTLPKFRQFAKPWNKRSRLLGQRVTMYPYRGGRQGRLKGLIAQQVKAAAARKKIEVDISVDPKDVLLGESWFEFLGDCKYVLGSEGGLSLLDPYGEIQDRINDYLANKPDATFEEVEAACFPGLDGKHVFTGFSPRILEAAVCGASQVLVEGDYRGLIQAERHYLPLKADGSNTDDVLSALKDEVAARRRVEACTATLVDTLDFRYSTLALRALQAVEAKRPAGKRKPKAVVVDVGLMARSAALAAREAEIGFRWDALANRVAESMAAQNGDAIFRGGPDVADVTQIAGDAGYLRAIAIQLDHFANQSDGRGTITEAFNAISRGAQQFAELGELVADLALTLQDQVEHRPGLVIAAKKLRSVRAEMSGLANRFAGCGVTADAAGFLQLLGSTQEQALAAATLVAPELENGGGQLNDSDLADAARVMERFRSGDRAAKAMSVLGHDLPDDLAPVLDLVLPETATTGGWYPDDLERLRQARIVLEAIAAGGDPARLLVAMTSEGDSLAGLISRLRPASGDRFSSDELSRIVQLDRILVRASGSRDALDFLERVQEDGAKGRLLFAAAARGGDISQLMLALAGAEERDVVGLASRMRPLSGEQFSAEELSRLGQLDRILVRAGEGRGTLDQLERVQEQGPDALNFLERFQNWGGGVRSLVDTITLGQDETRAILLGNVAQLANQPDNVGRFLLSLASTHNEPARSLVGSLAPSLDGSNDWSASEVGHFQVLTAVVRTLRTDEERAQAIETLAGDGPKILAEIVNELSQASKSQGRSIGEEDRRLVYEVAKILVRAPGRRALIRLIVGGKNAKVLTS